MPGATAVAAVAGLGWRVFLEPAPWEDYWLWLVLPIVVAVSVVFKAIREPSLARLPRAAGFLSMQVLVFLVLAAAGLWLVVELVT
jgi:hypothetical protein